MQIFIGLATLLFCTQCTWQPAHNERASMGGSLSVKASDPVFACRLKNELLQRIAAMKVSDRTVIRAEVNLSQGDLAYHPTRYAMRSQVRASATLTVDRPNKPTHTASFTEVTAFTLDQNEGWTNTQGCDHAHERLLSRLADVIMQELVIPLQAEDADSSR